MPNFKSFWILIFFMLNACSESEQKISTEQYAEEIKQDIYPRPKPNPDKNAYLVIYMFIQQTHLMHTLLGL